MLSMTETVSKSERRPRRGPRAENSILYAIEKHGGQARTPQIREQLEADGFFVANTNIQRALRSGIIIRLRPGVFALPPSTD